MEYCKYHPITAATHQCTNCHTFNCDDCCQYTGRNSHASCYLCRNELNNLGVSNNVTPFWRRLQESFSYPINFDSILLIIGLAILSTVAKYMSASLYGLVFNLLLTSALLKYCFSCLDNTSHGIFKAPEINEAYGAGFRLALLVFFMFIFIGFVIWATSFFFDNLIASIVTVVLVAGFPAMLIIFAMTENVIEALNPNNMLNLMVSIGLPYGLLLAFIMIMFGSVGIINQFIGSNFSILSLILQSVVTYYYMIVIFHIMGYMIYQYQDELGYERSGFIKTHTATKTVLEKSLSHQDILLKEGKLDDSLTIYEEIIQSYPEKRGLKSRYFELLLVTKSIEKLELFASDYLKYLIAINREDLLTISFKKILKVHPRFVPDSAELRFKIAQICQTMGDSKSVIRLINGLHKSHPTFNQLSKAYTLMANALDNLPNMQVQADKCRKLVERFS